MLTHLSRLFFLEACLLQRRARDWLYPLAFFCLVIFIFPLAFSPEEAFLKKIIPGGIWIAALFSGLLSIESVFSAEIEDGYLDQLLAQKKSFMSMIFAKLLMQWIATQLPLILLTPLIGWLFDLSNISIILLCFTLLLGTPILLLLNTLGFALTLGLRQQGMLLGLMLFPLITPVIIFGINIVLQQQSGLSIVGPLCFLAGLTILSITILPLLITFSLRLSLDD